tara:strand:- start:1163 stop:1510 length:348 start_codon:yes stop_codon:yes gene_type:complete
MTENLTFNDLPLAVKMLTSQVSELKQLIVEQQNQSSTKPTEQLLNIEQAAQFLNLAVATIYSKVSRGELPAMKRTKRLYFSSIELMNYIKQGSKKSNLEIEAEATKYLTKKGGIK